MIEKLAQMGMIKGSGGVEKIAYVVPVVEIVVAAADKKGGWQLG